MSTRIDPHTYAAAHMFGVAYHLVTPEQRQAAKMRAHMYAYSGKPPSINDARFDKHIDLQLGKDYTRD